MCVLSAKEILTIPKRLSEAVNRRTDNTMANRKGTKWQTMNDKTLHRKLKIEQHEVIPLKTKEVTPVVYMNIHINIDILQNYIIPCVCLFKNFIYPPLLGLWLWADEISEISIYEILIPNLKKSEWCGKKNSVAGWYIGTILDL